MKNNLKIWFCTKKWGTDYLVKDFELRVCLDTDNIIIVIIPGNSIFEYFIFEEIKKYKIYKS